MPTTMLQMDLVSEVGLQEGRAQLSLPAMQPEACHLDYKIPRVAKRAEQFKLFMQMGPQGLVPIAEFDTRDGVYDCAWSEVNSLT